MEECPLQGGNPDLEERALLTWYWRLRTLKEVLKFQGARSLRRALKDGRICHPQMCHFAIRIIWS